MRYNIKLIPFILALSLTLSYGAFAQTTTQSQKFGANPTSIAASAVLEIESSNKGVLFPRVTLTSTSDVTTIATPALGLTVFNTASAGTSPNNVTPGYYYWNGSKWVKMAVETPFAKTVYVNDTSPSTATIFDENNPPATNNNALKADDVNLYIGSNGSTWTYNTSTSTYNTFIVPASTPFNLASTTTDAGSEKFASIWRSGRLGIGTNNPITHLHVQHPTAATNTVNADAQVLRLSRPATGGVKEDNFAQFNLGSYENTGTSSFQAKTRLDLALKDGVGTASTNVMTWNANGNVGIGATAPTQRLDVNGSGLFRNGNASNTFTNNQILFGWNGTSNYTHSIKTRHQGSGAAGNAIDFYTWTNSDGASAVGTRHVLTIDGSGTVGVRTTTPQALLDVAPTEGSSSVSISTPGSAATDEASLFFGTRFNNRSSPVGTSTNLGWHIGARGNAITGTDANLWSQKNAFHASYWNGSALANHLTILPSGNMGIKGITNPQQALDINGTALFRINNNSAPQILLGFSNAHQVRSRHSGLLSASNAIDFNVWRATDLVATGAAVQVMTLQGDGKVGIGTNAPVSQLDVNTPLAATPTINTDANMLKLTRPTAQGSKIGNVAQFDLGSYAINGTDALTRLDLGLNNLQSLTTSPVMTWQANGNVGIGTTAPATTLEVANTNTTAFQSTINASSNPAALSTAGFNDANPNITKASSGIQFLGWNGKKEGGIFRQTGSADKSHLMFTVNAANNVSMVINESNNVGVGTTTPTQRVHIKGTNAQPATTGTVSNAILRIDGSSSHALDIGTYTNSPYGSYLQSVTTTDLTAKLPLVLNPTGGNVGIGVNNPSQALQVVGNIVASGTVTATSFPTSSDARLKSNVVGINNGLSKIMQLNPVNYDKKISLDGAATLNENGFIAQELQKIMPELVSESKDKDKLLSVNYTAIIPVLTKAVQEQQAIIEKQQMQINELKALLEKVLKNK
jgi:hypothetical protein